MKAADLKRMDDIFARWTKRAERYPDDFRNNRLQMIPVSEVIEDFPFLVQMALDADRVLDKRDAERLLNLDREFQEFEQSNRKDADAGRRVPMGLGKLVHTVRFLVGIAHPSPVPEVVGAPPDGLTPNP